MSRKQAGARYGLADFRSLSKLQIVRLVVELNCSSLYRRLCLQETRSGPVVGNSVRFEHNVDVLSK